MLPLSGGARGRDYVERNVLPSISLYSLEQHLCFVATTVYLDSEDTTRFGHAYSRTTYRIIMESLVALMRAEMRSPTPKGGGFVRVETCPAPCK